MVEDHRPLIAHVIYRLDYGGLENGLVNLINRMNPMEFRHAIICLAGYSDFRLRIQRTDVQVYSISKKPGKDFGAYGRLWRLLRVLRPSIAHTRNLGTVDMQWVALAAGVARRVHGEHGWEASDPLGTNIKNLWIRRMCRPAIHQYVSVSRDLANWLELKVGVSHGRVVQICNGVDTDRFQPAGDLPIDLPWRQQHSVSRLVFGTIGRLDAVKDQNTLLESFATLCANPRCRAIDLKLVIAGDGPLNQQLRARASTLALGDRIWFAGARDDVPQILRAIDVFVLPSLNEGISNTILEAMASGRAIVATRVGGNSELIESGVNGILYDRARSTDLADILLTHCMEPELRRAHGLAGRERAVAQYGLATMSGRYEGVYYRLMAARAA